MLLNRLKSLFIRMIKIVALIHSSKISKKRLKLEIFDANYAKFFTFMRAEVKLDDLYTYIHNLGFVKLDCTPHYKYARFLAKFADGEEIPYLQYMEKYYSIEEARTSIDAFLSTFKFVCGSNESVEILISKIDSCDSRIIIIDGVHRAAVSRAMGFSTIRCVVRV